MKPLLVALIVASVMSAGCSDGFQPRDGLYLGDRVTFRVVGGQLTDIRFTGVECRVAHPDNDALALCLERSPGLVEGTLTPAEGVFSGTFSEVALTGTFSTSGDSAQGTWRFETTCGLATDEPCVGEGEWTAYWREEITPDVSPEVGPDSSDVEPDHGTVPDAAPELPGDTGPVGPPPPMEAGPGQKLAHELVLDRRARAGTLPIVMDGAINSAAQSHAAYYSQHADGYQSVGLNPHSENPDWAEGYTGAGIGERLAFAGVSGAGGGAYEVMAFTSSTEAAIDGWMTTLYHRIPLIHPSAERWGYGEVLSGAVVEVGDFIYGPTGASAPAYWPPQGATDVSTTWWGNESPQPPLPAGETYPSGPIITLSYPLGGSGTLDGATLTAKASGALVPVMVRDPSNDSWLSSTFAMYALDPLAPGATYVVEFEGATAGVVSWEFTTAY